jgi:hypothetical protein
MTFTRSVTHRAQTPSSSEVTILSSYCPPPGVGRDE